MRSPFFEFGGTEAKRPFLFVVQKRRLEDHFSNEHSIREKGSEFASSSPFLTIILEATASLLSLLVSLISRILWLMKAK
jgi:hypothetical protein